MMMSLRVTDPNHFTYDGYGATSHSYFDIACHRKSIVENPILKVYFKKMTYGSMQIRPVLVALYQT